MFQQLLKEILSVNKDPAPPTPVTQRYDVAASAAKLTPSTTTADAHPMTAAAYFRQQDNQILISRQQASDFAKSVADDFNPLHDVAAKRFCVPGDLLFAIVLAKYGVTSHMHFSFTGMVTDEVSLILPEASEQLALTDHNNKQYLSIERTGACSRDQLLIDSLTRSYVAFSGQTFPHVLVPLLQHNNTMINPNRPMVMYQSMLIDLKHLDFKQVQLELDSERTVMEVEGKRGKVCLAFTLLSDGDIVGRGEKHMLLSGLRPFEQAVIDGIVEDYNQWKRGYQPR